VDSDRSGEWSTAGSLFGARDAKRLRSDYGRQRDKCTPPGVGRYDEPACATELVAFFRMRPPRAIVISRNSTTSRRQHGRGQNNIVTRRRAERDSKTANNNNIIVANNMTSTRADGSPPILRPAKDTKTS